MKDDKIVIGVAVAAGVLLITVIILAALYFIKKTKYMQLLKKANANASAG